jgi:hypothetical protein
MNPRLTRLIAAARKAYAPGPEASPDAPLGFATRIAALRREDRQQERARAWERLCWWGATTGVAICLFVFVQQHRVAETNAFDVLLNTPTEEVDLL